MGSDDEDNPNIPDRSYHDFRCKICDVHMSSQCNWNSHIFGKKHLKQLFLGQKETKYEIIREESEVEKEIRQLQDKEPVIGLSYIHEIRRREPGVPSFFKCYLCQATIATDKLMVDHVLSIKHRTNYIKEKSCNIYDTIHGLDMKKDRIAPLIIEECKRLQIEFGTGTVLIKQEKPKTLMLPEKRRCEDRECFNDNHIDERIVTKEEQKTPKRSVNIERNRHDSDDDDLVVIDIIGPRPSKSMRQNKIGFKSGGLLKSVDESASFNCKMQMSYKKKKKDDYPSPDRYDTSKSLRLASCKNIKRMPSPAQKQNKIDFKSGGLLKSVDDSASFNCKMQMSYKKKKKDDYPSPDRYDTSKSHRLASCKNIKRMPSPAQNEKLIKKHQKRSSRHHTALEDQEPEIADNIMEAIMNMETEAFFRIVLKKMNGLQLTKPSEMQLIASIFRASKAILSASIPSEIEESLRNFASEIIKAKEAAAVPAAAATPSSVAQYMYNPCPSQLMPNYENVYSCGLPATMTKGSRDEPENIQSFNPSRLNDFCQSVHVGFTTNLQDPAPETDTTEDSADNLISGASKHFDLREKLNAKRATAVAAAAVNPSSSAVHDYLPPPPPVSNLQVPNSSQTSTIPRLLLADSENLYPQSYNNNPSQYTWTGCNNITDYNVPT